MKHIVIADQERPAETSKIARAYGVGLECTTFYDTNYLEEHPNGIAEYLQTIGKFPYLSMHGPFTGLSTGVRDRLIREVTMKRYLEACATAQKLGVRDIVIHNNYYDYCAPRDVWRENTKVFFADLLESIRDYDVRFHIENTLERDGDLIAEIIQNAGSSKLSMCLDVGHTHGMAKGAMPALDWITSYRDMIGHVHLHNNHGERDEHNNLQNGTIPMEKVLEALEHYAPEANWCIECGLPHQDVTQSLEYLVSLGYLSKKENCCE